MGKVLNHRECEAVNGFFSPLTIQEEEIWHDYALSLWFVQKPCLEHKLCMEPLWMLGDDLGSKASPQTYAARAACIA